MNFKAALTAKARLVDQNLDRYLPPELTPPGVIHQAMRYSVLSGGKRLRPALVIGAAEACGGAADDVILAACGIELIHCYSLVHDDLPAMDNDDLRRGRPTNHKVFGEAIAILVGDALLTLGFELLARAVTAGRVSPAEGIRVLIEVAEAIGTSGMVGGQVLDISTVGTGVAPQLVEEIHRRKTGALFIASVRAGAILAGASDSQLADLTRYASEIGLVFQITDDILDVVGETAKTGKGVGGDAQKKKLTYPGVYGLPAARKRAKESASAAIEALKNFDVSADFLREAAQFIISREY
ncbi:MAG: polyprenyl synthetase family protein [Bacillota bacterium]